VVAPSSFRLSLYPDAILDRDPDLGTPHFVRRRSGFLSPPAPGATPEQIVAAFVKANARTFTLHPTDLQPSNARVHQDYETKHNGMRHVRWQQQKDGLDIYGATFSLNLTRNGEIVTVSSRALHIPEVRFHRPEKVSAAEATRLAKLQLEGKTPGEPSRSPNSDFRPPKPVWYPLDMISAVLSWDLIADIPGGTTHRFIIRADTGEVVEDMNLTWGLEPITLRVYTNDSPSPFSPGMNEPTNYSPPTVTQALVTGTAFDTNASPQGWVPDSSNELVGNNAEVYSDVNDANERTAPWEPGLPYRQWVHDTPGTQAIYQPFYWANVFHDRLYALGFDEAAGNFQEQNFDRGGHEADRMRIEVWNGSSVGKYNQANITVQSDGTHPRMQLYLWDRSGANRDSALDAETVFHEAAHGVSTRLIGDGEGLFSVQARGMGEGWSDFIALSLLSEPGDDLHGVYAYGGYLAACSGWTNNYYFGIRRFPYTTHTNKAPQTFLDTDPNQTAFPSDVPRNPMWATSGFGHEEHNIGEVWCLALWECRANLIERWGFAGNETMLQLVVDGMKLLPVNPTFTQARDTILLADSVNNGGANQIALWRGFASRGLGWSARLPWSPSTVGIVEAFDLPFAVGVDVAEVDGDGDGYVEPGEGGALTVVLTTHEMDLSNITVTLSATSSNVTVTASNAAMPDVSGGGSTTSAPPFGFTVDAGFPALTDAQFLLRIECDKGAFEQSIGERIGNPSDYPPGIFNVAVTNVTETNAWVIWTTGIPADGRVEYGTTTNYGMSTALDPTMRTSHMAELPGLVKGAEYHFRIVSQGSNVLQAVSGDFVFRTRAYVYVNANSTATQDVGTIESPFKTLQTAAEAAKTAGDRILLVAAGVYTDRSDDLGVLVLNGWDWDLTVRGGYSPDFQTCDPIRYETIIDGEQQRRGIFLRNDATLSISGVTITRGAAERGGGVNIGEATFAAFDCVIAGNGATNGIPQFQAGGGGSFSLSQVTLMNCLIAQNTAGEEGGGLYVRSSTVEIRNCRLIGNLAGRAGGGLMQGQYSDVVLRESTVASNIITPSPPSNFGGGICVQAEGVYGPPTLNVMNCIVYANTAPHGNDLGCGELSEVHLNYSTIGDIYGTPASSNHLIRTDPLFANPAAGDFHLLYGSPCIDTGDPAYNDHSFDIDGEPRPFGAAIDMGADEFTDADGDHMADYWELARFGTLAASDGTADGDADGLDDFGEYMHQTDPHDRDTDRDLAADGWEVANGFNPLNRDQDGDGMWDGWEVIHNLNAFTNDAAFDPDHDTANNLAEFTADTDPWDSNSVLRFLAIDEQWGGTRIDWKGGREAVQFLETSTDLLDPVTWTPIYALPPPTPITNAVIHFGVTNRAFFYRIRADR